MIHKILSGKMKAEGQRPLNAPKTCRGLRGTMSPPTGSWQSPGGDQEVKNPGKIVFG